MVSLMQRGIQEVSVEIADYVARSLYLIALRTTLWLVFDLRTYGR